LFINSNTDEKAEYPLVSENGLWYYVQNDQQDYQTLPTSEIVPMIQRLTNTAIYELMHARMGHPGEKAMLCLHNITDGVPKLKKPPLFRCATCTYVNLTKRAITQQALLEQASLLQPSPFASTSDVLQETGSHSNKASSSNSLLPGQMFHMDMGFVRGTKYGHRDEDGHLVTSLDGYNSYLVIVDRATRYTWVFLCKTKVPQITTIAHFLKLHGTKQNVIRKIRTDGGGELYGSHAFQQAVRDAGFLVEPTASDASFQNGITERPNRTFGNMMRSLLHAAGLGPEYWSWALIHAAYLKNRLPHSAIPITPYEAYTGVRPNLKHVQVFGSPIIARQPGKRPAKLDSNSSVGIFLGYTATANNIYYMDHNTKKIKIGTHVVFDEAGYTIPPANRTVFQERLQFQQVPVTALTHQEFLPAPAVDTGITPYGVPCGSTPTIRPTERLEHNDSSSTNNQAQESHLQSTFEYLEDVLQVRLLSPSATMPS
jgi:hypothetical protein